MSKEATSNKQQAISYKQQATREEVRRNKRKSNESNRLKRNMDAKLKRDE